MADTKRRREGVERAGSGMLAPAEVREAAAGLRRMLEAVESGDLNATDAERDYLAGAVETLDKLTPT